MLRATSRSHLALTIIGCFGGGSLYGWSGYLPAVRAQFDVNNATASLVFSLALVGFTFGVLLGPVLLARVPSLFRLPILAGAATLSLVVAGTSAGFLVFTVAYGVCFGFTSGALYNFAVSLASASSRPMVLVPVTVAAFGLGGAVFGPVHVWLTDAGWGLWSIAPALAGLAAVTLVSLILRSPAPTVLTEAHVVQAIGIPRKKLLTLWVIFSSGSCAGLIVLGFAAQFLSSSTDSVGPASLAVFLAALGNTLGRLSSAWTADRFGPAYGIAGSLILTASTLLGLFFATAPGAVLGLLFLIAFAYGQLAATTPLLVRSQVRGAAFSRAFGWVFTGWGVAGLVGPWTAGWVLDATGRLQYALIICMALTTLSFWLVLRFARSG